MFFKSPKKEKEMKKLPSTPGITLIITLLIITLLIISASGIWWFSKQPSTEPTAEPPPNQVIRVIDGDTFEIASGDTIRLLCINTPEENKEGYQEAKDYLENLILDKEVILEADIQEQDKYNRALRYVYLNNSDNSINNPNATTTIFINKEIYKAGHAEMMIIPPSDSKCNEILN